MLQLDNGNLCPKVAINPDFNGIIISQKRKNPTRAGFGNEVIVETNGITANCRVLGFDAFSRRIYHLIEIADGFFLHPRQNRGIDIHGNLGLFVAQSFLHHFNIHTLFQHQGGVGMAGVMKPDAG